VQEVLGHAHISITLGLYAHVTPKMLHAAARTMDDLFRASPTIGVEM
jgi:site-specific recombinase XerD